MPKIEPRLEKSPTGTAIEYYDLPAEEGYLKELLTYIFETHWEGLIFGPLIEGGAFEIRCPCAPKSITLFDGYLTVHFGRTHFHLCIGDNMGSEKFPTPPELREHRRTKRAEIYRRLDREGCATSWGLQLHNGQDEQLITIIFTNPFLTDEDGIADEPDWSRLAMWEDIGRRYLGRELDAADTSGKGFKHG